MRAGLDQALRRLGRGLLFLAAAVAVVGLVDLDRAAYLAIGFAIPLGLVLFATLLLAALPIYDWIALRARQVRHTLETDLSSLVGRVPAFRTVAPLLFSSAASAGVVFAGVTFYEAAKPSPWTQIRDASAVERGIQVLIDDSILARPGGVVAALEGLVRVSDSLRRDSSYSVSIADRSLHVSVIPVASGLAEVQFGTVKDEPPYAIDTRASVAQLLHEVGHTFVVRPYARRLVMTFEPAEGRQLALPGAPEPAAVLFDVGDSVRSYEVAVAPVHPDDAEEFAATTELVLARSRRGNFPQTIVSERRSYLLNRVRFPLLGADRVGAVNLPLNASTQLTGVLCPGTCPPANARVSGLGYQTFVEAINASQSPHIVRDADEEAASWPLRDLRDGVAFTYIRYAWLGWMRPVVNVLLPVSRVPQLLLLLAGSLLGGVTAFGALTFVWDRLRSPRDDKQARTRRRRRGR